MEQRDRQALEDILGVLDRALEFPIPNSQTLEDTTYLQDAVIRCLGVLGEATKRLSREIRIEHTQVSWRAMAGMRDVLFMPTIKSIGRRSGWLTSSFQRSEARSLRSLSTTPEAKDLLASGGDWLICGGDKAILSALAWPGKSTFTPA